MVPLDLPKDKHRKIIYIWRQQAPENVLERFATSSD